MAHEISDDLKKCAHCKKTVNPSRRYYRNNRYYCTHNCWRAAKSGVEVKAEGTK